MAIPFIPMRKPAAKSAPLPVVMSGVRLGERVLQIGVDDPAIAGAIASKVGVSGRAAFAVADERAAAVARQTAENAMALAEIEIATPPALPFDDRSFDLVVINARAQAPAAATLTELLRQSHRVLRPGGRVVAMEAGTPVGVTAWLRSSKAAAPSGVADALAAAGFKAVRVLADREGYLFTEGLKGQA